MEENNNNSAPNNTAADNGNGATPGLQRPARRHRRDASNDKYFTIRNPLKIIFMIGAIFYFHDRTMGTIVILTAMAFKIAECCFRFIRQ